MSTQDITRINTEMQKRPEDSYLELVGHYVIDRLAAGSGPLQANRTLEGCMDAMEEAARKKARHNVGALTSTEVYKSIDQYFGFPTDFAAQQKSAREVCAGMGMTVGLDIGPGESVTPPTPKPIVNLNDFL